MVVFSDLHLGDGGGNDDFKKNGELFLAVLRRHYLEEKFTLILNGDIEELARFPLKRIMARWGDIYRVWAEFAGRGALIKLVGNHDLSLLRRRSARPALSGHRGTEGASGATRRFSSCTATRPRIGTGLSRTWGSCSCAGCCSRSVSATTRWPRSSRRRFRVEKRIYGFARRKKVLAMIGHTHRPLFESLSRLDALKIEIENLCRRYPQAALEEQRELETKLAAD